MACASNGRGGADEPATETNGGSSRSEAGSGGGRAFTGSAGGTALSGSASSAGASSNSGGGTGTLPNAAGAPGSAAASGGGSRESDAGSAGQSGGFEQDCLARATSDCERCVCQQCTAELQTCATTAGCPEIAACTRENDCQGIDCYCGAFDAITCAGGQADGPCKDVILQAPGGHVPTLLAPSAGPASDAAVAVSVCMQPGHACAESCPPK